MKKGNLKKWKMERGGLDLSYPPAFYRNLIKLQTQALSSAQ
jgi:hypothetical protein